VGRGLGVPRDLGLGFALQLDAVSGLPAVVVGLYYQLTPRGGGSCFWWPASSSTPIERGLLPDDAGVIAVNWPEPRDRRLGRGRASPAGLAAAVIASLGVLALFKYADFRVQGEAVSKMRGGLSWSGDKTRHKPARTASVKSRRGKRRVRKARHDRVR